MNVAFQRSMDGEKGLYRLGGKLTNPMELPIGIATMKAGTQSTLNFVQPSQCMKLAMYCNEIADAEFFWSAAQRGDAGASRRPGIHVCGNNIKSLWPRFLPYWCMVISRISRS